MAEFLVTQSITKSIESTIKDADFSLTLVSPYLQIGKEIRQLVESRAQSKTDIKVVYGKQPDLEDKQLSWLLNQPNVRLFYLKDLHAKIYLNETQAIVTSMNLYQYSQDNNREAGILVRMETDKDLYKSISQEVKEILEQSVPFNEEDPIESPPQSEPEAVPEPKVGYCVYDRKPTYYNKAIPLCDPCAARKETRNYYCHSCGEKHKKERPLIKATCWTCYKAHFPAEAQQWVDSRKRKSK